jgi:hypothetical protein
MHGWKHIFTAVAAQVRHRYRPEVLDPYHGRVTILARSRPYPHQAFRMSRQFPKPVAQPSSARS